MSNVPNTLEENAAENTSTAKPDVQKLNLSNEALDTVISDWKKTFDYNSTFIDFSKSFSSILTLFSIATFLVYLFASLTIKIYPFFVFAMAAAITSCIFKVIEIVLFASSKSAATKSFTKYCKDNGVSLEDLIRPTLELLAEKSVGISPNAAKFDMKELDLTGYRKFYFVYTAWKLSERKEPAAYETYSYIFSAFSSLMPPILYFVVLKANIFSTTTSSYIYILAMVFVLLIATVPNNYIAKKRVIGAAAALEECFPVSKGIQGKYRVLINQMSMLLTL